MFPSTQWSQGFRRPAGSLASDQASIVRNDEGDLLAGNDEARSTLAGIDEGGSAGLGDDDGEDPAGPNWTQTGATMAQEAAAGNYMKLGETGAAAGVSAAAAAGILSAGAATGIGLAIIGVAVALDLIFNRRSAQQKVETTGFANATEPVLKDNRDVYLAQPIRTRALQAAALSNFDIAWSRLVKACGDPREGDAGVRCISERQRGGVAPWCPKPGNVGCDWFALYRDPIANDAGVVESAPGAAGDIGGAIGGAVDRIKAALGGNGLLIGGVALVALAAVAAFSGEDR